MYAYRYVILQQVLHLKIMLFLWSLPTVDLSSECCQEEEDKFVYLIQHFFIRNASAYLLGLLDSFLALKWW